MKMVFHVGLGKNNKLPIRMVPLAVIGTWTTHLFGGSAGREGVAVQIGAAVSNNVGRLVDKTIDIENSRKMFLITGMAAGFFRTFTVLRLLQSFLHWRYWLPESWNIML